MWSLEFERERDKARISFAHRLAGAHVEEIGRTDCDHALSFASQLDDADFAAGDIVVIAGGRSHATLDAIARCVERRLPFMLLDHESSDHEPISRAIGARALLDAESRSLRVFEERQRVATALNAMYLVRSSASGSDAPKCFAVSYAAFLRLEFKVTEFLSLNSCRPKSLHIVNRTAFGFFLWDILLSAIEGVSVTLHHDNSFPDFRLRSPGSAVSCTPSMLQNWIARDIPLLPDHIYLSGERLAQSHLYAFRSANCLQGRRLVSSYALTETGGQVAMVVAPVDQLRAGIGGRPMRGCLIEEDRSRLRIRCDTMATARLTENGFECLDVSSGLLTEDLGTVEPDGTVVVAGRSDAIPKRNGIIIDVATLRTTIQELTCANTVHIEIIRSRFAEIVACVVIGADLSHWCPVSLFEAIPNGVRPDIVMFDDTLTLSPNGKAETLFRRMAREQPASAADVETRLRFILVAAGHQLVLDYEDIGLYDLGMTSRDIIILHQALGSLFSVKINLRDLYQASSLVELSEIIFAAIGIESRSPDRGIA